MERRPFSEILKEAKVDIQTEYRRLYDLFYTEEHYVVDFETCNIRKYVSLCFNQFKIRGTCLSLDDFDRTHKFNFSEYPPRDFDINYLLLFCEYSYNLVSASKTANTSKFLSLLVEAMIEPINLYIEQVDKVIEKISYIKNEKDGIVHFVPRSQTAISVAEIIDPELSFDVIEYNHHSMNGDIERKTRILEALAKRLEPKRLKLREISNDLEHNLFDLYNNFHLRHNNEEGRFKKPYVVNMSNEEREPYYDDIYQMSLLAFLLLDNEDRKERITELLLNINRKQ